MVATALSVCPLQGGGGYGVNYPLGVDVIGAVGMGIGRVEAMAQIVLVELNEGGIGGSVSVGIGVDSLGGARCG